MSVLHNRKAGKSAATVSRMAEVYSCRCCCMTYWLDTMPTSFLHAVHMLGMLLKEFLVLYITIQYHHYSTSAALGSYGTAYTPRPASLRMAADVSHCSRSIAPCGPRCRSLLRGSFSQEGYAPPDPCHPVASLTRRPAVHLHPAAARYCLLGEIRM